MKEPGKRACACILCHVREACAPPVVESSYRGHWQTRGRGCGHAPGAGISYVGGLGGIISGKECRSLLTFEAALGVLLDIYCL